MNEGTLSESLEALEVRWELEQSPQLAMRLAEAYRNAGRSGDALRVLEEELDRHPAHVGARVALGRAQLEAGLADSAAETLTTAVEMDATNLVAQKLLLRSYLELGETDRAADRLATYETLNAGDEDLETFRAALVPQPSVAAAQSSPAEPFGDFLSKVTESDYWASVAAEGIFTLPGVEPSAAARTSEEVSEGTVTLGRLYLEQGHREDAKRILNQVAEREPENEEAREALEEMAEVTVAGDSLTAADLLLEGGAGLSVAERKKAILQAYLRRIKPAEAEV